LYKNGKINYENLERSLLSEKELMSDLRSKGAVTSLDEVDEINMETSGEVSVIKKK
jgi:uncharacterized membrane protein YcaP (DUF421 family)